MSLPTNFSGFENYIYKHLSQKIPVDEVLCFISSNSNVVATYIHEFNEVISFYNKNCHGFGFQEQKYLINSLELSKRYPKPLPMFEEMTPPEDVYRLLANSTYFQEVWQVRPINLLVINLLLLIYRTTILLENKAILLNEKGVQKVQISSAIEEIVFYLNKKGIASTIFPAFEIWYKNWRDEGFSLALIES